MPDLSFRFGLFFFLLPSTGAVLCLLIFKVLDLVLSLCGLPGYRLHNRNTTSFPASGETFLGLTFLLPCPRALWEKNLPYVKEPYYGHAKDELWGRALFRVQILAT